MMKKPNLISALILSFTLLLIFLDSTANASVSGAVSLEGETFNFQLSGQKNWDYDLKRVSEKGQSKVQLFVKSLDKEAIDRIRNIENPFVRSINVKQNAIDNKWLIEFVLKGNNVETFDYLTDQPSKLIVDFYEAESPIEADLTTINKPKISSKKSATTSKTAASKVTRKPADVEFLRIDDKDGIETSFLARAGLFDAGDAQFSRFTMKDSDFKEEAVIKSRSNYYLKFPVLESDFSFWKKMQDTPPTYEIKPEKTVENKQARLLKTLFDKKRYLVFLQTAEWFNGKFPDSKYTETIAFMKGDAYINLWKELKDPSFYDLGQNAYRLAVEKYPESVLAERTSLLTGLVANDRADYMFAIRKLNQHIENKKYEGRTSNVYAKLALTYALSKINRTDDALRILADIEKVSKDPLVLAEIAVRRGDYNFFSKKLGDSISYYDLANKNFPIVSKLYPSAYFNKMEALFWKGKYKESHQAALDFAQYFPAHEFAPYALTRVGELLEILGGDQSKSVGAYLETHFRYGDSPKTIVAKLHLLSTKMRTMKNEELDLTLQKMDELAKKSDLPNVDQFKVTMLADGFSKRKNYPRAIQILSDFYQSNPTRPDVRQVTQRIVKNISDELKYLSEKGDYKALLQTHRQYSDTWLKTHGRIDTDYLLGLSYEHAGAYDVAISKYKKVFDGITAIKGTAAEKEARVDQYLPSMDSLYLRLAKNNFENHNPQESYMLLEKIQKPLGLTEEEQIERVVLASDLYEKKGDSRTSIRYLSELSNLWKGDEKLSLPVQFKLAEMQAQKGDIEDALTTYEKCSESLLGNPDAGESQLSRLANSYSQLLVEQGRDDEAVALLNKVIRKFGNKFDFNQERYLLGDLLFKKGEIKKAEQAWAPIKDNESNVWRKLSQEKLKQAAWDEDHKNHIRRIPAMSQREEEQ